MKYLLLIQSNPASLPSPAEWESFITRAHGTGMFLGGSEVGAREVFGNAALHRGTSHIDGYMVFSSERREDLVALLRHHPVVLHGGAVELCELPES